MSVVLFFGFTSCVVIAGFIYVGLTIRHHIIEAKKKQADEFSSSSPNSKP